MASDDIYDMTNWCFAALIWAGNTTTRYRWLGEIVRVLKFGMNT